MWIRKDIKDRAKQTLSANYWVMVAVSTIMLVITGGIGIASSNVSTKFSLMLTSYGETMTEISSIRFIFVMILLAIVSMVFSLLISFFVTNVISVGGCRFFVETSQGRPNISDVFFGFSGSHYMKIVRTMFLETVFLFLWMFTIVGFFIKMYEYAMIPYILAQDPDIEWRDAFKLSKRMMYGNKWKMFVLGLSFMGWLILSGFTFGILAIFYVYPYMYATYAELYNVLKVETPRYYD